MSQKVAIITGAGQGIGRGIAKRLLFEHMNVVIAEENPKHKKSFSEDPSRLLFVETDVREESAVKKMVKAAIDHFGQIDALINNAGILVQDGHGVAPEKLSLKEWNAFIETNLTGAFLCAKYAAPYLRKQKGAIVNIASTRAFQSEPHNEAYSASKGGLVSLTHALAMSLGPDIRVNCICPGWIHTETQGPLKKRDHSQHPVGRVGKVEDVAALVSFLISEEAGFITAQNYVIDGGMTKKMVYEE